MKLMSHDCSHLWLRPCYSLEIVFLLFKKIFVMNLSTQETGKEHCKGGVHLDYTGRPCLWMRFNEYFQFWLTIFYNANFKTFVACYVLKIVLEDIVNDVVGQWTNASSTVCSTLSSRKVDRKFYIQGVFNIVMETKWKNLMQKLVMELTGECLGQK